MKVQNIAKMSMYTRNNGQGKSVKFSGKSRSMAGCTASVGKGAERKARTAYDELCDLASSAARAFKKSYEKSEINRAIVKPLQQRWNDFSAQAPTISKAIKGLAWVAVGVGVFETAFGGKNK